MDVLKLYKRSAAPRRRRTASRLLQSVAVAGVLATSAVFALADSGKIIPPEVLRVVPARQDSMLVCILETVGLPDARSAETLSSGLPSSLTIVISMVDAAGKEQTHARSEIRMLPDPLEGHITIEAPFGSRRTPSLAGLSEILHSLGPLPVAAWPEVPNSGALILRARVAIHPLAPSVSRRVQGVVTESEGGGRREFSIGIGSLLRYFLGQRPGERWDLDMSSPPFRRDDLKEAETDS